MTQTKRNTPEKNRGGKWVLIGGEEFLVPPLSLRSVVDLEDRVQALRNIEAGRPTPEQMNTVAEIVHAALARNYPSISVDDVGDMLDLGNFDAVLSAVLSIGGFRKEPVASGEVQPEAPTGTASIAP